MFNYQHWGFRHLKVREPGAPYVFKSCWESLAELLDILLRLDRFRRLDGYFNPGYIFHNITQIVHQFIDIGFKSQYTQIVVVKALW